MSTNLVMMGDYACSQEGYNEALNEKAVQVVDIDEASYAALYNVQKSVEATCLCRGVSVSLGLVRDGKYIPLDVVEDTSWNSELDYGDLDDAFELGLVNIILKERKVDDLRKSLDVVLGKLSNALEAGSERDVIDHCIDCLDGHKINCLP